MTKRKNKNISEQLKPGAVIKTRDEYLEGSDGYVKDKYKNNNIFYRELILVESNRNNEFAVEKVQSSGTILIENKAKQIEKCNPRIKTKDDKGKPIKLGAKFKRGNPKYDVSERNANQLKKEAVNYKDKKIAKQNRKKLRELKGRKKGSN